MDRINILFHSTSVGTYCKVKKDTTKDMLLNNSNKPITKELRIDDATKYMLLNDSLDLYNPIEKKQENLLFSVLHLIC